MFSIEEFEKKFAATQKQIAQSHSEMMAAHSAFDIEHAAVKARIAKKNEQIRETNTEFDVRFEQSRVEHARPQAVLSQPVARKVTATRSVVTAPVRRSSVPNSVGVRAHQQHMEQNRLFQEQMQRDTQQQLQQMHMNMHHGF